MGNTFKWMTRSSGVIWALLGLMAIFSGKGLGFIFLILGLIYVERTTGMGEEWAKNNPIKALYVFAAITTITMIITFMAVIVLI